jgi:3-phenylpropionate/trans-cinnamate dioxygenase ferredoxin subunit
MEIEVCRADELPPGTMKVVHEGDLAVGVFNLGGEICALEDRCSHDDGALCEGEWDPEEGVAICPRHGARFDIRTGRALTLPAYLPVDVYPVRIEDGVVLVDLPG